MKNSAQNGVPLSTLCQSSVEKRGKKKKSSKLWKKRRKALMYLTEDLVDTASGVKSLLTNHNVGK